MWMVCRSKFGAHTCVRYIIINICSMYLYYTLLYKYNTTIIKFYVHDVLSMEGKLSW